MSLSKLIEAVEAGRVGQFRNLDSECGHGNGIHAKRAYDGSLDAARALHDAVLPGSWVTIHSPLVDFDGWFVNMADQDSCFADNPARAWLLAILRAMEARDVKGEG